MKHLIAVCFFLISFNTRATTDAHTRVHVVVKDINSEEFFIERAPIVGCYGLAKGPQLLQFTAPLFVTSNIGCGNESTQENINYLTCARVTSFRENRSFTGFSEITLDISGCPDKHNPKLITMIRTAAKLNFPLPNSEVKLQIIR